MHRTKFFSTGFIPFLTIILLSIGFTSLAWISSDGINPDGILYIDVAKEFNEVNLEAASIMYDWPFYSAMIGIFSEMLNLSYLTSAQSLNIFFLAILALAFWLICRTIFPTPQAGWFAIALIFILPSLNEYRSYVIRDIGFWAMFLCSVAALAHAFRNGNWLACIGWQAFIAAALAFRIEAIVYATLAPLCLFWSNHSMREKFKFFFRCNCLFIFYLAITFAFFRVPFLDWVESSKVSDFSHYIQFNTESLVVTNLSGREFYDGRDVQIFIFGLIVVIGIKTLEKLGIFSAFVGLHYYLNKYRIFPNAEIRVIFWIIPISVLNVYLVMMQSPHLQGRFVMPIVFLVLTLLVVPFQLLVNSVKDSTGKKAFIMGFAALTTLDAFVQTGNTKHHLVEAGAWFESSFPSDAVLLANDSRLYFYGGRQAYEPGRESYARARDFERELPQAGNYNFVMVRERGLPINSVAQLEAEGRLRMVRSFESARSDDRVVAYTVVKSSEVE